MGIPSNTEPQDGQNKDNAEVTVGQAALGGNTTPRTDVAPMASPPEILQPAPPNVDVSAYVNQNGSAPRSATSSAWKNRLLKSYAYLPEYLVMLLVLTGLLYALTSLLNLGIDSVIHAEKGTDSSYLSYYDISTFELVTSLAAIAVSLPTFIWLFIRTKAVEAATPAVTTHRWRKAFLGTFIAVQLLTIIGNVSYLAYQLISRTIDTSNTLSLVSGSEEGDPWWQLTLASIITVSLLGFVVFMLGKEYRNREDA